MTGNTGEQFPLGALTRMDAEQPKGLDRFIFRVIAYLLPLLLLLACLLAWTSWPAQDEHRPDTSLLFRVASDPAANWTPELAASQLSTAPAQLQVSTRLASHPFWLQIDLRDAALEWLEFPSRHATSLSCWQGSNLLGQADRSQASGLLRSVRSGFALDLSGVQNPQTLVCKASFLGPARIVVLARSADDFLAASERFSRDSGLLDGGLLTLSLFLFITALINRNSSYVLFALWMVLNLRMASLSIGADVQWLGQMVPGHWLPLMRSLTLALYYVATYALFRSFFREELVQLGRNRLLRLASFTCLPVLVLAVLLPYGSFLPIIWVLSGFNILVLLSYLVRLLWETRSRVALWYAGSIAITLFASLVEVLAASLSAHALTEVVNSVTAALSSSLLASLAVAAQMKHERDRRLEAQTRLQAAYEGMPLGLFAASLNGDFVQANPAQLAMLGDGQLLGQQRHWQQHFQDNSWATLLGNLHQEGGAVLELQGLNGRRYLVRAALSGDGVGGVMQDVTEQSLATERLRFMALNDPLTRALNRRGVEQALAQLQSELPAGKRLPLAYLDLDRFKLLNDLYGHAAGDEVLQQVCARINTLLSDGMQLARVGGDEFVLLLPGVSLELACLIGRGVLTTLSAQPYQVGDRAFQVRGSLGMIEVEAGTSFKDAMTSADRACREAKRSHSNGLVVFEHDAKMLEEMEAEMQLVARLAAGGEVEGLYLEMQPIMNLRKPQETLNFEVLLRMRDAEGRPVPTPRLITAGEHSGRMSMIDRWVMRQTLDWLQAHHAELPSTQFVCMNLSGASLNDECFIEDVFELLDSHRKVAPLLCLEITESVALHDLANTQRFIQQVRQFGTKVALDDFGAGYTSFSYLKDLPSDLLKIDGSFIRDMNEHPANIAIVEAIVSLARNLGMRTIAEWAEDAATVETLAEIGVDHVQGWAIARSMSPEALLTQRSAAGFVVGAEMEELVARLQRQGSMPDLFVGGHALT